MGRGAARTGCWVGVLLWALAGCQDPYAPARSPVAITSNDASPPSANDGGPVGAPGTGAGPVLTIPEGARPIPAADGSGTGQAPVDGGNAAADASASAAGSSEACTQLATELGIWQALCSAFGGLACDIHDLTRASFEQRCEAP